MYVHCGRSGSSYIPVTGYLGYLWVRVAKLDVEDDGCSPRRPRYRRDVAGSGLVAAFVDVFVDVLIDSALDGLPLEPAVPGRRMEVALISTSEL